MSRAKNTVRLRGELVWRGTPACPSTLHFWVEAWNFVWMTRMVKQAFWAMAPRPAPHRCPLIAGCLPVKEILHINDKNSIFDLQFERILLKLDPLNPKKIFKKFLWPFQGAGGLNTPKMRIKWKCVIRIYFYIFFHEI